MLLVHCVIYACLACIIRPGLAGPDMNSSCSCTLQTSVPPGPTRADVPQVYTALPYFLSLFFLSFWGAVLFLLVGPMPANFSNKI